MLNSDTNIPYIVNRTFRDKRVASWLTLINHFLLVNSTVRHNSVDIITSPLSLMATPGYKTISWVRGTMKSPKQQISPTLAYLWYTL